MTNPEQLKDYNPAFATDLKQGDKIPVYLIEPVDIHDLLEQICERLGLKAAYVNRIDITPTKATVHLYIGQDGLCEGPKYTIKGLPGLLTTPAEQTLTFNVKA